MTVTRICKLILLIFAFILALITTNGVYSLIVGNQVLLDARLGYEYFDAGWMWFHGIAITLLIGSLLGLSATHLEARNTTIAHKIKVGIIAAILLVGSIPVGWLLIVLSSGCCGSSGGGEAGFIVAGSMVLLGLTLIFRSFFSIRK